MKKRKIILSVSLGLIAIGLLSVITCVAVTRSTQASLELKPLATGEKIMMPLRGYPYMLECAPGLKLKFDTGADVSVLTEADADKLRSMGYEVTESWGPVAGRDGVGAYTWKWRRYHAELPVGGYECTVDSAGKSVVNYKGRPSAVLRNVDFMKVDSGISTFGLDVIRRFKIECLYNEGVIALLDSVPGSYTKVVDMVRNIHLTDHLWSGVRSYITVSVNQRPNTYLIDTGLQRAAVKNPLSQSQWAKHTLRRDSIRSMVQIYDAYVDDEAWVDFGMRSGTKKVFYYDNPEDEFQINPLNVFQQDMLFDIEGKGIYFRIAPGQ